MFGTTHSPRPRGLRRSIPIAAAGLGFVLLLAGCTTSSSTDDDTSSVLTVGIASLSDADSLDPAEATTTGGYVISRQVFDTLTEFGPDGNWTPQLATAVEPGDTADVWTVTLADDATWSDGDPVTADDVVATVKRWFAEELPPSGSLPFIDPDQVEAVDEHTVKFTLLYPTVTFPEAFTSPTTAIVPADFDPAKPIGSGPFVLSDNDPGVQLTFTANKDYFRGAPGVDELDVVSFADATSAASALTAGQIDVDASVDPTIVDVIDGTTGYSVFDYGTSGTLTWVMNTQQAPFDDPVVRQALRLAVDRQQLIDQVYNGYGTLGNDVFNPYDPMYDADLPQREYDPEAAKAMLEAAGYTLPLAVKLVGTDNQPTSERQNEVLVQQAAAAGFDIQYEFVDSATFYGDAYGTYPLSLSFWGFLGIFDQAAFTITATAPYNSSHWTDPEYDALFDQAIQTVDDTERKDLVAQMQTIEYDSGPYIVPMFLDALVGLSDDVSGATAYPNSDGAFGYNFRILSLG
ncbi:ABC transporter substrate-binding protein [Herbiconiux ginsengi]|uniref:Peptide/nickel transport system substrate-binding protein n=1 Tax=Herbiconiux ginsengi TaxID=381665 RepID=A0A1H3PEG4_9MICO|nr:ABC transporter substrate-binding protein [Herbiconiux ginsengi]SDY99471.1 peptide/nickel transport system substrate-binding protein [Herbiconiux ginsengi]